MRFCAHAVHMSASRLLGGIFTDGDYMTDGAAVPGIMNVIVR